MSGRLLRSAIVVGTAASFAVLGVSAGLANTSRTRVSAKRPSLLLDGQNVQRAHGVAAGDPIERTIVLRVRGRGELRIVALAVVPERPSLLTDRKQGLQLSLERCSVAWHETLRGHSYTCPGTRTRLLTRASVLGTRSLRVVLRGKERAYLRLRLTLPTRAGNALEHQSSRLVYRFTAVAQTER